MKPIRLTLLVASACLALVLVVIAVVFSSAFQTWVARRVIAAHPEWKVTLGSVNAGWSWVELKDLRLEQEGAVLSIPVLEAELPVITASFGEQVRVSRLEAKGWTLDLSAVDASPARVNEVPAALRAADVPAATAYAAGVTMQAFAGVFGHLALPIDLTLDGVQLDGNVILPAARGHSRVVLAGGGLEAGRDATFVLAANSKLADPDVAAIDLHATIGAAMDTPRTFNRLTARLHALATGAQFPDGVQLRSQVTASRTATGEVYSATIDTPERQVLAVQAKLPPQASRLEGTWELNVRDADIAPFALGLPLPEFAADGEGKFDTDVGFTSVHVHGELDGTVDRLEAIKPELAAVDGLTVSGTFDLAQAGGAITIRQLDAAIAATQPVASVRALQTFEFTPAQWELRAGDPAAELLGIVIEGLPVSWISPFVSGLEITGRNLRGELVATASAGGIALRSRMPLTIEQLGLRRGDKVWARDLTVNFSGAADCTPQGWQAEVAGLSARSGDTTLLLFDAKAGQLAGAGQPLKIAGRISANLAGLMHHAAAELSPVLTRGETTIEFVASMAAKREVQASVAVTGVEAMIDGAAMSLPDLTTDLRADIAPGGQTTFNAPLLIERDGRKSDLAVVGTMGPAQGKSRAIDAQVTSEHLVVDDARVLAALIPGAEQQPETEAMPSRDAAPPWAGVHGTLALQLKRVIYSDTFEMTNVAGRIRLDAGRLKLETVQAALGETGVAQVDAALRFDAQAIEPYTLVADVAVKEFDPGPLMRAMNGGEAPIVEGKFDISSKLWGRAATIADLAMETGGDFQLTSKGGVFRGVPVNASNLVEDTSALANILSPVSTAIGALTGKKEYAEIASRAQAIGELTQGLSAISFDQLSVVISRDAALNTTLRNFTLISPELRLIGSGQATHTPGTSLLDDALTMEFKLRARGRQGELLRYLGALEPEMDDMGYAACTLPLKVGGTLGHPDTTELNIRLAALALEKGGVGEKASELFNKLLGNGK